MTDQGCDRYRILFDCSPDVLMLVAVESSGEHFRILEANPATELLSGIRHGDLLDSTLEDLLPAEQSRRLGEQYRRCYLSGETTEFELPLSTPSGNRTWQIRINPYREQGVISHLVVSARDITLTRDVAQLLNSLEGQLPGFVYQIGYFPGGEWRYTFASSNAQAMFGISSEQIMADAAAFLGRIHPEDSERVFTESERAVAAMTSWHSEFRMVRADGSIIWLSAQDVPQKLADGTVLCTGYANDITEKKAMEQSMRRLAEVDSVTNLASRSAFMSRLGLIIDASNQSGQPFALLYLDLDGFKQVNDRFGHQVGDDLLRTIGDRLASMLRRSDQVGRIGGDEFMVVLAGPISADNACAIGDKICRQLAEPIAVGGECFAITASVGVALFPDHGENIENLSRAADLAMYAAKALGGRRACLADVATGGVPCQNQC